MSKALIYLITTSIFLGMFLIGIANISTTAKTYEKAFKKMSRQGIK